jgi:sigma-B regulation protein RsbU (phosphoserine phosphatase)
MNLAVEEPQVVLSQSKSLRILVGDDQPDVLEALRLLLKSAGHRAVTVESPNAVLRAAKTEPFDLILMDLNYARDTTSGQEGLNLLNRLHAEVDAPPIVVMTAWGNIELAVEAMRCGASDFIQKPWDNARLLETIDKQSRRREKSEMDLARHVQRKLFPQQQISLNTLDSVGRCIPAREVSGDYYDFLDLSLGKTAFILADVSGKGMAAALLMANLQASFRSQFALAIQNPLGLVKSVNTLFFEATPPEHYATLFYGEYDDTTRELAYLNCGHLPQILVRAGGSVERLESSGTVLGMFRAWNGELRRVSIQPGDTVALFSDGVTEAGIESGSDYGEDRLTAMVKALKNESVDRVLDRIIDSVKDSSGHRQSDDITLILLRGK